MDEVTDLDELDVFCALNIQGAIVGEQRLVEVRDLAHYLRPLTPFVRTWAGPSRMGPWSGFFDPGALAIPNDFDSIARNSRTNDGVFVLSLPSSRDEPDAIVPFDLDRDDLELELRAIESTCWSSVGNSVTDGFRLHVRRIAYEKLDRHWCLEPLIHSLANDPSSWADELMDIARSPFPSI